MLKSSAACKRSAFTLIEVVIALALFAVSVLMLSQSFVNGLICKRALTQGDSKCLTLDTIRYALGKIKRGQISSNHTFYLPDCADTIQWQGNVQLTPYLGLYNVEVKIQNEDCKYSFWVRRREWITQSERLQLRKLHEKNFDENEEALQEN
ncbi:MAG: prepilin-type N-terminal cleavage/methylation domain-containing protein [Puniceicoccales bacterium]|nr:prepilin-type N-terminal cleavage/methylation domain-containing protein [Puniceicoccales bacterium]